MDKDARVSDDGGVVALDVTDQWDLIYDSDEAGWQGRSLPEWDIIYDSDEAGWQGRSNRDSSIGGSELGEPLSSTRASRTTTTNGGAVIGCEAPPRPHMMCFTCYDDGVADDVGDDAFAADDVSQTKATTTTEISLPTTTLPPTTTTEKPTSSTTMWGRDMLGLASLARAHTTRALQPEREPKGAAYNRSASRRRRRLRSGSSAEREGVSARSISGGHVSGDDTPLQPPRGGGGGDDDGPSAPPHGASFDPPLPRTPSSVPTGAVAFDPLRCTPSRAPTGDVALDPPPPRVAPAGGGAFGVPPAAPLSPFAVEEDTEFLKHFRIARREHISSPPSKAAAAHSANAVGGTYGADDGDAAAASGGGYSDSDGDGFHAPSSPLGQLRAADDCLYVLLQACRRCRTDVKISHIFSEAKSHDCRLDVRDGIAPSSSTRAIAPSSNRVAVAHLSRLAPGMSCARA